MAPSDFDMADMETGAPLLGKQSTDSSQTPRYPSCLYRQSQQRPIYKRFNFWVTYFNLFLFITSVFFFARRGRQDSLSRREALKATSAYSPIFDLVDLSPKPSRVDGRLHVSANASVYRGDPSPETDAAWEALAAKAYEVILVDSNTLSSAGFNPQHYFKAPASWDAGDDAFPVQIDVFHQIHCLNAIRKQMHYDHYYAAEFGDEGPSAMHWMHQKHCLHMVLQSITCNANVDIVPHRWVEEDEVPFAQFGIERQCRNFEALSEWNKQNAVHNVRDVWAKSERPKDAFVWPGYGEEL